MQGLCPPLLSAQEAPGTHPPGAEQKGSFTCRFASEGVTCPCASYRQVCPNGDPGKGKRNGYFPLERSALVHLEMMFLKFQINCWPQRQQTHDS